MTSIKIELTRTVRIVYNITTVSVKPFNRTSMELKRKIGVLCYFNLTSFNRTSMELKRDQIMKMASALVNF